MMWMIVTITTTTNMTMLSARRHVVPSESWRGASEMSRGFILLVVNSCCSWYVILSLVDLIVVVDTLYLSIEFCNSPTYHSWKQSNPATEAIIFKSCSQFFLQDFGPPSQVQLGCFPLKYPVISDWVWASFGENVWAQHGHKHGHKHYPPWNLT